MVNIIVNGALGQMGREIITQASGDASITVVAGLDPSASEAAASGLRFPLLNDIASVDEKADVLVDFSHPSALGGLLQYCTKTRTALVLGTTGYSAADKRLIEDTARLIPIFQSPSMSYGVAVLADLTRQATKALGSRFDVEIVETHHRRKVDAPSGTALMLADAVITTSADPMNVVLDRSSRHEPRQPGEIGVVARRGGTVAGAHTVGFFGDDEVIELSHAALSRRTMAGGALRAALYIAGKGPGLYTMTQLLAEQSLVTHIGLERDVAVLSLEAVSADPADMAGLFGALKGINVDMISAATQGKGVDVAFSIPQADLAAAVRALAGVTPNPLKPHITEHLTKLTVEGEGMAATPGVTARVFACLADHGVSPCQVTTSETKITMAVKAAQAPGVVEAIRAEFGL